MANPERPDLFSTIVQTIGSSNIRNRSIASKAQKLPLARLRQTVQACSELLKPRPQSLTVRV
ncbi:hypothetical protein PC116_g31292 [Phytophthora cactorum]|nr:hypothetical protein PC116_g31292 [Phytophthora cactorum]